MKKYLCLSLLVVLLAFMASCSSGNKQSADNSLQQDTAAIEDSVAAITNAAASSDESTVDSLDTSATDETPAQNTGGISQVTSATDSSSGTVEENNATTSSSSSSGTSGFLTSKSDNSTSTDTSSKTLPTDKSTSGSSTTPVDRAAMGALLADEDTTFNQIKDAYDFKVTNKTQNNLIATSEKIPSVTFQFFSFSNDVDTFYLVGVSAPASMMLPEYVGMKIDDIPIHLDTGRRDVQFSDKYGGYQGTVFSKPGYLSADDIVYMMP